ncbi:MAG: TfoX/Sxy family protein [bacterium]|jgi:TfoX/Sxy family transcriptional regulator of competence genes
MYDDYLAERVRQSLQKKKISFEEKKMMGGLAFMVNDKMCVGINQEKLMARVGPEVYESSLAKAGVNEMDFTKKPMKGWIYVSTEAIDQDSDLDYWIQLALDYNPHAKSSKRK